MKYRDSREGIIRANRIVMNDLPDGIKTIRITENRLNMPQVTTETDVASLKNHLAGEPLGHETTLAQKTRRASGSAVHRAGLVYRQITL
ncbi:putative lipoprotein [Escherichia coli]|uniref:Putative lipoprotein n=1 Tax=Escherichia coli TaxID=562 RepID=A0A377B6V4_ECOLX|nr:putative lipoprotein [Escherichia coli]